MRIKIDGKLVRFDRSQAGHQSQHRGKPLQITRADGSKQCAFGAEIDGILRIICRPLENPVIELDGQVTAGDPRPRIDEPPGYAHVYIFQTNRYKNLKSDNGVPAIIARWNGVSRYANEVIVCGHSQIVYGCRDGFRQSVGLWIQTGSRVEHPKGPWQYDPRLENIPLEDEKG